MILKASPALRLWLCVCVPFGLVCYMSPALPGSQAAQVGGVDR